MSCLFWGKWAVEQGEAGPVRSSSTAVPNTPERAGEPRQAFSNWPTERRIPEANRPSGCTWSTSGWSTSVASQGQPSELLAKALMLAERNCCSQEIKGSFEIHKQNLWGRAQKYVGRETPGSKRTNCLPVKDRWARSTDIWVLLQIWFDFTAIDQVMPQKYLNLLVTRIKALLA